MMDKYEQMDLFSGVILLAKDGKIIFDKAYGFADRESKIRNNLNTEYRLASVSKLFTIVTVLKLYDEGKLSMDDNLGKYLEGFSNDISEKVKIRHLLTMTAGFGNFMSTEEYFNSRSGLRSLNDDISIIRKEKLLFEPGSNNQYSNSGFVLLGGIIEKITGKSYFEYVKNTILIPAGMNNTYFSDTSRGTNEAVGYQRDLFKGDYDKDIVKFPSTPAANALSTADDLLKFALKVCTTNDIISEKAKILFFSDYDTNYKEDWNTLKSNTKKDFAWVGSLPGVSTLLIHSVGEEITVVVLSNFTDVSVEVTSNLK